MCVFFRFIIIEHYLYANMVLLISKWYKYTWKCPEMQLCSLFNKTAKYFIIIKE